MNTNSVKKGIIQILFSSSKYQIIFFDGGSSDSSTASDAAYTWGIPAPACDRYIDSACCSACSSNRHDASSLLKQYSLSELFRFYVQNYLRFSLETSMKRPERFWGGFQQSGSVIGFWISAWVDNLDWQLAWTWTK